MDLINILNDDLCLCDNMLCQLVKYKVGHKISLQCIYFGFSVFNCNNNSYLFAVLFHYFDM